jgi:hypothetical protein
MDTPVYLIQGLAELQTQGTSRRKDRDIYWDVVGDRWLACTMWHAVVGWGHMSAEIIMLIVRAF